MTDSLRASASPIAESKHTPGPWLREGLTVYALDDQKSAKRFSFNVQEGYLHHTCHECERAHDELEATAILAQAAPVMFDALHAARDTIRQLYSMRGCEAEGEFEEWVDFIDAALAKAEGPS